jgi:isoleucyl-tRNA synthetase
MLHRLPRASLPRRRAIPIWKDAYVVIWTTTPWTIPGNRAISFSDRIAYGLYEVTRLKTISARSRARS